MLLITAPPAIAGGAVIGSFLRIILILESAVELFNRLWRAAWENRGKLIFWTLTALLIAVLVLNVVHVVRSSQDRWQVTDACVCAFIVGWMVKAISGDKHDSD